MDKSIRITVLLVAVSVAAVCWMAVAFVYGDRLYYLTEDTTVERMNGVVERLNSEPLYQSDDGAVNKGYFLSGRKIQHRIVMPEDWNGEFGTVELPAAASHLPNEFLDLVQQLACAKYKSIHSYIEDEVSLEVVFLRVDGQPIKRIQASSTAC